MGVLSGVSNFLFGVDDLDTSREEQEMLRLRQQAEQFQAREAQDYAHQAAYAQSLQQVIAGNTVSAAQRQFQANADQINRNINSTVAGASGNTGALGRYGAILAQGDALSQANQFAAVQQAQEIAAARQMVGGVYANQGGRSAGLYGQVANVGLGYDQIIAQKQMANQRADAMAQGALLGTASTIGATALGGPAAGMVAGGAVGNAAGGGGMSANSAANGGGYAASLGAGGAGAPAYVISDPLTAQGGTSSGSAYGPALNYQDYPGSSSTTGGMRYPSYGVGQR